MGFIRKDSVAKIRAFCEWPCLIGVLCAIVMLLLQSTFIRPTDTAASSYLSQRSLQDIGTQCRQEHSQPMPEHSCTADCLEQGIDVAGESQDKDTFGWSILTCAEINIRPPSVNEGVIQTMLIEVIQANHRF